MIDEWIISLMYNELRKQILNKIFYLNEKTSPKKKRQSTRENTSGWNFYIYFIIKEVKTKFKIHWGKNKIKYTEVAFCLTPKEQRFLFGISVGASPAKS